MKTITFKIRKAIRNIIVVFNFFLGKETIFQYPDRVIPDSVEKFLVDNGWCATDYPFKRGEYGYDYTVYFHDNYKGTFSADYATELTQNNH